MGVQRSSLTIITRARWGEPGDEANKTIHVPLTLTLGVGEGCGVSIHAPLTYWKVRGDLNLVEYSVPQRSYLGGQGRKFGRGGGDTRRGSVISDRFLGLRTALDTLQLNVYTCTLYMYRGVLYCIVCCRKSTAKKHNDKHTHTTLGNHTAYYYDSHHFQCGILFIKSGLTLCMCMHMYCTCTVDVHVHAHVLYMYNIHL